MEKLIVRILSALIVAVGLGHFAPCAAAASLDSRALTDPIVLAQADIDQDDGDTANVDDGDVNNDDGDVDVDDGDVGNFGVDDADVDNIDNGDDGNVGDGSN